MKILNHSFSSRYAVLLILLLVLFFPLSSSAQVTFSDEIIITTDADEARYVYSIDLDGDGDNDILSASSNDDKIAWYENPDGTAHIITTDANGANCVFSIDLDGDGDNDVLSTAPGNNRISWFENTDGLGSFGDQQIITSAADGASCVYGADLNGDGDIDVLSASSGDDKIAWYENTDGLGDFGNQQIITTLADGAWSLYSCDLDGDGDYDVLSASSMDDKIAWYENTDGLGDFGDQQIITFSANYAMSVFSADLDGDGDFDVLSASYFDHKIAWYENLDGLGDFSTEQIITNNAIAARSVYSIDIDNDGDNDVLSASRGDNTIAWYENIDGLGDFGARQIISDNADNATSVFSIDLDGDGDHDVLFSSYSDDKIACYLNEFYIDDPVPPQNFSLMLPVDGAILTSIELSLEWGIAHDPNQDLSSYWIYLSEDPDNLDESFYDSTLANSFTFTGEFDTQYWWSVLARDSLNHETWADRIYSFTIVPPGQSPLPFNLLQPDSGSIVGSNEVLLEWEAATDPDGNFHSYDIYLDENLNDLYDSPIENTNSTELIFSGEFEILYWWTVLARDSLSNETWAEQVYSFTLVDGFHPLPFNLLQPDSGSILVDSLRVFLEWEESIDPDDDLSVYRIYITDNPDNIQQGYHNGTLNTYYMFTGINGNEYWWTIAASDLRDNLTWANQVYSFTIDINSVDKQEHREIPTEYELTSIYPNPFNPVTSITIGLPKASYLAVDVYNILGQQVATLADRDYQAGYRTFEFNGSSLAGGIYFVKANVPGQMEVVRKIVLMK